MAGSYVFHNKLHRASHHTLSGTGLPDAGLDPIASIDQPFIGIFYNVLPDVNGALSIKTSSLDWWSTWTTVNNLSSIWAPTQSIYVTLTGLSADWSLGFSAYTSLSSNSAKYESAYTTVKTYSADWSAPYKMFTNIVQEYTAAKTFAGTTISFDPILNTATWDVALNQITFLNLSDNITFNPVVSAKRGGVYVLTVIQDSVGGRDIAFDPSFRFNSTLNINGVIATDPNSRTVITFIYDGNIMYGHRAFYYP